MERKLISEMHHNVDKFISTYKENPLHARVMALSDTIHTTQVNIFIRSEFNFDIVTENLNYGVSKNLKKYFRRKKIRQVFIKPTSFYIKEIANLKPLCAISLQNYEYNTIVEKYGWVRFLRENRLNIPFNSVVKYKLYDLKKALSFMYKAPYPYAVILHKHSSFTTRFWRQYRQTVIGITNINEDIFSIDDMFIQDAISMAYKLNKTINLSWSSKRFKQEHDDNAMIIAELTSSFDNRELNINPIFTKFAEHNNIKLLTTTKELAMEGIKQAHCVANYSNQIDSGFCAIYRYKEYTVQINRDKSVINNPLTIQQIRGYRNVSATEEIRIEIQDMINVFNNKNFNIGIAKVQQIQWYA